MKQKAIRLFILLGITGGVFAQQGKVGINTIGNPQATLDVNGTVRVGQVGDYNAEALYLGRHKTTRKLVHLNPTQTLFEVTHVEEPFRKGMSGLSEEEKSLNADTRVNANQYYAVLINPRLVKSDGKVPVMQVSTLASDDAISKDGSTVLYTGDPYYDGLVAPAMVNYSQTRGRAVIVTPKLIPNNSNPGEFFYAHAKAVFSQDGKTKNSVLFYSPPKYLITFDRSQQNPTWRVRGGLVNQLPLDSSVDATSGQPTMKYMFDVLKIPVELVKETPKIELNITGIELNNAEPTNSESARLYPPIQE